MPTFDLVDWFGICARRDMPAEIRARWAAAIAQVVADPELRPRLIDGGITPQFEDTDAFAQRIASDRARCLQVIRAVDIRAD